VAVERDLCERVSLGFLRRRIERRPRSETSADVGDEEARRHGCDRHGDPAALELRQGHGRLPVATPLRVPNRGDALREIASEERDVLRQVEVPVDDRHDAQRGRT
jgi:hypothetical protein